MLDFKEITKQGKLVYGKLELETKYSAKKKKKKTNKQKKKRYKIYLSGEVRLRKILDPPLSHKTA